MFDSQHHAVSGSDGRIELLDPDYRIVIQTDDQNPVVHAVFIDDF